MAQVRFALLPFIGAFLFLAGAAVGATALSQEARPEPPGPGIYLRTNGQYQEIEAESLTWRLGAFTQSERETRARLTGRATGSRSRTDLATPVELLMVYPKDTRKVLFHVLRAGEQRDRREFQLDFVWQQKDFMSWRGTKNNEIAVTVQDRPGEGLLISVPLLSKGEYGILVSTPVSGTELPAGKIYTFTTPPGSPARGGSLPSAAARKDALPVKPGIYLEQQSGYTEAGAETFDWFPLSFLDTLKGIARVLRQPVEKQPYTDLVSWQRMNGTLDGQESRQRLPQAASLVVVCPEGMTAADYWLVGIAAKSDRRDFALDSLFINTKMFLGFGQYSLSPGPEPIPFEAQRIAPCTYRVLLPKLKPGHYGLLHPGSVAAGRPGAITTFEIR